MALQVERLGKSPERRCARPACSLQFGRGGNLKSWQLQRLKIALQVVVRLALTIKSDMNVFSDTRSVPVSPPLPFRRVRQSHGGGGEREEARQTSRPTGGQAVQPTRRPFQSGSLINLTQAGAHRWGENIMIILGGIFPILLMIVQEPRKDTRF